MREWYARQAYRHVSIGNQAGTVQAFDKVKKFILSSLEPSNETINTQPSRDGLSR